MQDVPARRGAAGALSATHRAGAEAAAELIARSASAHTRRVYASALGLLAAWLDGGGWTMRASRRIWGICTRPAARRQPPRWPWPPCGAPHATPVRSRLPGRSPARPSRASAARRPPTPPPAAVRPAASPPRSAPPCSPPAGGRAAPVGGLERAETAERRGLVDAAIVALLFHGALRRSEVAVLCWADVELADGGDVVVTVRRSKTNQAGDHPDVRRLVGGCAAAVRRLQAATAPEPGDAVIGLSVDQVNRRFCGRLRRGRARGPQNLARRPRGTRRRAHRPRGRHPRRPARRRLEGRQHGGTLRRLGRHPRRRRQPLHAMKERPARAAGEARLGRYGWVGVRPGVGC